MMQWESEGLRGKFQGEIHGITVDLCTIQLKNKNIAKLEKQLKSFQLDTFNQMY